MQVFLYEFITGGGLRGQEQPPSGSLLAEGAAMLRALAEDFCRLGEIDVVTLRDDRLPRLSPPRCRILNVSDPRQEQTLFRQLAQAADWTVVIAPEFDGLLARRCREVFAAGGKLLGPGIKTIQIAADKHHTAEHLRARGIPMPEGILLRPGEAFPPSLPSPAVIKPVDGAGSLGVRILTSSESLEDAKSIQTARRLERFYPGEPASVAVLCGSAGMFPLVPCRQRLSGDGRFRYEGGVLPLAKPESERAIRLACRAIASLPDPRGYLGVDLVLGADPDGGEDVVIEINPRLTTSYVGLRVAAETNLAAALLAVAEGNQPQLSFRSQRVEFDADGTTRIGEQSPNS